MTTTTIDKIEVNLPSNQWLALIVAIDNLLSLLHEFPKMPLNELMALNELMTKLYPLRKQLYENPDCICEQVLFLEILEIRVMSKISSWFQHRLRTIAMLIEPTERDRILKNIADLEELNRRLNAYQNAYSSN